MKLLARQHQYFTEKIFIPSTNKKDKIPSRDMSAVEARELELTRTLGFTAQGHVTVSMHRIKGRETSLISVVQRVVKKYRESLRNLTFVGKNMDLTKVSAPLGLFGHLHWTC